MTTIQNNQDVRILFCDFGNQDCQFFVRKVIAARFVRLAARVPHDHAFVEAVGVVLPECFGGLPTCTVAGELKQRDIVGPGLTKMSAKSVDQSLAGDL